MMFRNYSADISLWSFYKTQKLKIGALSTLIDDPDSATLNYREEKQVPMNADHQGWAAEGGVNKFSVIGVFLGSGTLL